MSESVLTAGTTISRIRYLLSDVVLYGVAALLVPLIGLAAVPLLTRQLAQADYGLFELLLSYVGIASVIAAGGQDSAAARFYYDSRDEHYRRSVLNQAFWTQCFTSVAVAVLFSIVVRWWGGHQLEDHPLLGVAAALAVPAAVLFNFTRNMLKWTFLRREYVYASVGYSLLVLGGYAMFVMLVPMGTAGAILTQCLAGLAVGGLAAWRLRAAGVRGWGGITHPALIHYGIPYVLLGLLTQGMRVMDKTFLTATSGLASAAVYAVGFKIASMLLLVESTFNLAWGPIALAIHKEKTSADTYNVALALLSWLIGAIFLGIALFAPAIVGLLAPASYHDAAAVAAILGLGFVIQSIAGVAAVGVELAKKPWIFLVTWALGMAVAAAMLVTLPRPVGLFGTAAAVSLGLSAEGLARTAAANLVYPLRLNLWLAIPPVILATALALAQRRVDAATRPGVGLLLLVAFLIAGGVTLRNLWLRAATASSNKGSTPCA